jgi:hypothetical protein
MGIRNFSMRKFALRVLAGVAGVTALWVLVLAPRPRLGPKIAGLLGALAAVALIFAISGSRQSLGGLFGAQNSRDGDDTREDDG